MNEDERRRYFAGRYDWPDARWQDHCGVPDCRESGCRDNYIDLHDDSRVAALRLSFAASILGAEVDRL